MTSKFKNEFGVITIDNEVIARTAGLAAMDCAGIAGMAAKNVTDGIVRLLKRESLSKGIKLSISENSLVIDMHIIVEYGTNISAVCDTLISTVKYKVEDSVGLLVKQINIFVESVRVNL